MFLLADRDEERGKELGYDPNLLLLVAPTASQGTANN
jgi:hypothetical protein